MNSSQTKRAKTVRDYLLVGGVSKKYFDSQNRPQPNRPAVYKIAEIDPGDLRTRLLAISKEARDPVSHEDVLTCYMPLQALLMDPEVKDLSDKVKRAFESHS